MRLSTARATTLLLTLAAGATAFVPDLLAAAPPTLITLDAPTAPNAIEVADLRAAASLETEARERAADPLTTIPSEGPGPAISTDSAGSTVEPSDSGDRDTRTTPPTASATDSTTDSTIAPTTDSTIAPTTDSTTVAPQMTWGPAGNDGSIPPPPPLLVSTVGDSSMMFMNAGLAKALGPERWQPVPTEYARWTDGTGGFDRHGCGPTGDSLRIYFSQSVGPLEPRFNHPDELEHTCDWRRWIPGGLELAQPDVVVASWGPTTMWGWERDGKMVDLTDPVIRTAVAQAHAEVRDAMLEAGVQHVIWVAYPPIVWRPYFERNREEQPWSRPAVADELFELLTELDDTVVDLRDMNDPANFGDGLHFTEIAAAVAAQRILAALPDGG
jgi:hypothetical protein